MLSCFSQVQLLVTLWTVALPGSSVHRILQVRILEWVAMPSSRGSSQPRDQTHISYVSCNSRQVFFFFLSLAQPGKPDIFMLIHATFSHSVYSKSLLFIPYSLGSETIQPGANRHSSSLLGACIPEKEQIIHKYNMWSMLWRKVN